MSKSPNTDAQVLDVTVQATETEIAHNLGRAAVDGFVIRQFGAGTIFRGSTVWNETNIYLVGSIALSIRFYVF